MKKFVLGACLAGMTAVSVHAQMNSDVLKWGPAPAVLPQGAQMAVLSGDPGKAGLFTVRLKMPAGYAIQAHHHPTTEYVTVVSGDFALGMGDKLDQAKATTLHAGGFAAAPAGMNHYAWAVTDAVVQVHAEGPFALTYANPADDPSKMAAAVSRESDSRASK
jgi:quercetin dioxygenase-like cupin family protein